MCCTLAIYLGVSGGLYSGCWRITGYNQAEPGCLDHLEAGGSLMRKQR